MGARLRFSESPDELRISLYMRVTPQPIETIVFAYWRRRAGVVVLFHENNLLAAMTEKANSLRDIPLGAGSLPLLAEMMKSGKRREKMHPETTKETGKKTPPVECGNNT